MSYRPMPTPASEERIAELARDILGGQVYTHTSIPPDLIRLVFFPAVAGGLDGYTTKQLNRLVVWASASRHKTMGRYINGYPMFAECCIWRRRDFEQAKTRATRALEGLGVKA